MERPTTEQISTFQLWKLEAHITDALIMREGEAEFDESYLEELELAFDDKVDACAKVSENMKAEINILEEQIQEMRARVRTLKRNREGLLGYVKSIMEKLGLTKAGTGTLRVRIQKSPVSVEVRDPVLLPKQFRKITIDAKKSDILRHIRSTGEIPEGVVVFSNNTHLRVY